MRRMRVSFHDIGSTLAAYYSANRLGLLGDDTIGRERMTLLERVVFLADGQIVEGRSTVHQAMLPSNFPTPGSSPQAEKYSAGCRSVRLIAYSRFGVTDLPHSRISPLLFS